jgi:hypothetical protein
LMKSDLYGGISDFCISKSPLCQGDGDRIWRIRFGVSLDRVVVSASLVRCQGAGISEIVLCLTDLEVVRMVE